MKPGVYSLGVGPKGLTLAGFLCHQKRKRKKMKPLYILCHQEKR
jgi:hypothetical protein